MTTLDSWCYDEEHANCQEYGRLYFWNAAMKACPEGWRVPTIEEWRSLACEYGCPWPYGEGYDAFRELMPGGSSGFNGQLGGQRYLEEFSAIDEYGGYWSSDLSRPGWAWHFYFSRNSGDKVLINPNGGIDVGRSCRCVQDIEGGTLPFVKFSATPNEFLTPLTVNVNASRSYDPDGEIVSYEYDFGDGTSGSGLTTTHTYNSAGSYIITLTVTDDDGYTGTTVRRVEVE